MMILAEIYTKTRLKKKENGKTKNVVVLEFSH